MIAEAVFNLSLSLVAMAAPSPASGPSASTTKVATTAPVATPATAPAVVLDQSSPNAFLKSFFASHGEVDDKTLRASLHAANPLEQKLLDSVVQIESANARLRSAEAQKFGKPATNPAVSAGSQLSPGLMAQIDTFVEKIDADGAHATVTPPLTSDPNLALHLVKVEGKWKLSIASLVGTIDPATGDTIDASTHAQVAVIDAIAADVKAGKLANEDQVKQELSKRLAERLAAATRTMPATAPAAVSSRPSRGTS